MGIVHIILKMEISKESYYLNVKLKGKYKSYYDSGELREIGEYVYDKNNIYSRKNSSWKI